MSSEDDLAAIGLILFIASIILFAIIIYMFNQYDEQVKYLRPDATPIYRQYDEMRALLKTPQVVLPPNKSLNFNFTKKTFIFIFSSLPLKVEPDVEVYYHYLRTSDGTFKVMEIMAPPNTTVRIVNNNNVSVMLATRTMEVPSGYLLVNGELSLPPGPPEPWYIYKIVLIDFIFFILGISLITRYLF